MTVYAPTPTEDFARCPVYQRLNKLWEPRGAEWTPAILLGRAIGEGMSQFYRTVKEKPPGDRELALATALKVLEEDDSINSQETWSLVGLTKHVKAGLMEALDTSPVRGPILMVDEPLGSGARPDVVYRHPSTGLSVADTKVRFKLDPRYREKALAEYDTWWQGWHYAWEVGEYLGEPVKSIGPHLITLTPKVRGEHHPIEVSPARVSFWLKQAEVLWARMGDSFHTAPLPVELLTPNWFSCYGKFGRCFAYDACHTIQSYDEDKLSIVYQPKRPT